MGWLQVGNKEQIHSYGHGTMRILTRVYRDTFTVTLKDRNLGPGMMFNFISKSRVRKATLCIITDDDKNDLGSGETHLIHKWPERHLLFVKNI